MPTNKPARPDATQEITDRRIAEFALEAPLQLGPGIVPDSRSQPSFQMKSQHRPQRRVHSLEHRFRLDVLAPRLAPGLDLG